MEKDNTMVIDGRLHRQKADGLYVRVPLGMDDARAMAGKRPPEYAVEGGKPFVVVDGAKYAEHLKGQGMETVTAVERNLPETEPGALSRFLQTDRDVAMLVPGRDGKKIPLTVEKGGYLDITDMENVRGVSAADFAAKYEVTAESSREVPFQDEVFEETGMESEMGE